MKKGNNPKLTTKSEDNKDALEASNYIILIMEKIF